jgi:GNAT superfamily N-acetyltransferase
MIICDLKTKKEWRGRGYASELLRRAIWEARRNGCKVITLEDCSDYYDLPGNIYLKHGFKYTRFEPTMELHLDPPEQSSRDTEHCRPTADDNHCNE